MRSPPRHAPLRAPAAEGGELAASSPSDDAAYSDALSASGWPTGWPGLPLYYSNVATQTLILDHAVQTHFLLFCSAAAPGHAQLVDAFYQAAQNFTEHRRRPLHVVMPLEEAATAGLFLS